MLRFALACIVFHASVLTSDIEAAVLTSSVSLEVTVEACIPFSLFLTCNTKQMSLSDPTFVSGSLSSSITDPSVPATYTVSYMGYASANSDHGPGLSVQAFSEIRCGDFANNCLIPDAKGIGGNSFGQSEVQAAYLDQITFYTGLGSGFYQVVAHENVDTLLNSNATSTFQGMLLTSEFGGIYTTSPMPFADGVPFTLSASAMVHAFACCLDGNSDAGNGSIDIIFSLIALDSNMQPLQSLGYTDNIGKPYGFLKGEAGTFVPEPSTGILVLGAAGLVLCPRISRGKRRIWASRPG